MIQSFALFHRANLSNSDGKYNVILIISPLQEIDYDEFDDLSNNDDIQDEEDNVGLTTKNYSTII
jgi:hypothetical protein